MPAACFYTHTEFVQKNPNTCQALANAIVHGLKWLQTAGPSDIIKTVPEGYLLGDRALYLASFNKVREAIALDGILPDEGARTALRALASFDPSIKPEQDRPGQDLHQRFRAPRQGQVQGVARAARRAEPARPGSRFC